MKQGRPFIIWTLQRTGGTNLARRLFETCGLLPADREGGAGGSAWLELVTDQWKLHEPFNYGGQSRTFGEITRHWVEGQDHDRLAREIGEIVDLKLPLKHCVEMVPWTVTETLAKAAVDAGYVHIFLFRKEALGRLLSLHFAKMSGVWGAHFANQAELDDRIYREPLPIDELLRHESFCVHILDKVWGLFRSLGVPAFALAYEDIYRETDGNRVADRLLPVLRHLGLSQNKAKDREFIREVVEVGDQGTRDKYGGFAGIDQLSAALATSPRFTPQSDALLCGVSVHKDAAPELCHVAIDLAPTAAIPGQTIEVGGVVVIKGVAPELMKLKLRTEGRDIDLAWSMRSPRMARLFPTAANSGTARFKQAGVPVPGAGSIELLLCRPGGETATVGTLNFTRITEYARHENRRTRLHLHRCPQDRHHLDLPVPQEASGLPDAEDQGGQLLQFGAVQAESSGRGAGEEVG